MSQRSYPNRYVVTPLSRRVDSTVRVPGSKSITNRALVLAALDEGDIDERGAEVTGVLHSEDTEVMVAGLRALGFTVQTDWEAERVEVRDWGERVIPATQADLFVGNSGTTMRFLTALVSVGEGRFRLDGVERMRERPIQDLLDALRQLGVNAYSERENGCPPVVVESRGWQRSRARVRGDISSQFLSALLMAALGARREVEIEVEGPLVSTPYVSMTLGLMQAWGARIEVEDGRLFRIPRQEVGFGRYHVEPDASAASYFWASAAITGGKVTVPGLTANSLQGDVRFVDVLEEMGCTAVRAETGLTVHGGPLRGIDVDMNDSSDTVMTLAAVALFAEGPTTIRNVAHIRHKETDRLSALATELRRLGAGVEEFDDGLRITPAPLHGALVETYNDHRMAMSLTLVGLRVPGVVIKDPACVAKTYPDFFSDLERLYDEGGSANRG